MTCSIYMDDRTFTAKSAIALKRKIDIWHDWSWQVGLLESAGKAQAVAIGKTKKSQLEQHVPVDMLKNDALFLGVATGVGVRSDHDKEIDRVNLAQDEFNLRLGFETFCTYARLFGMSAVSYGWISRLPTKTCCNKLWRAVGQKGPPTRENV